MIPVEGLMYKQLMNGSPISLIQWLPSSEYQETQTILSSYAQTVNMFHRSVELAADAEYTVSEWLNGNTNAQYCFIGTHGNSDIIGASSHSGAFASWNDVWGWFSQHRLLGGLWLGACKSSSAAEAFSRLLATEGDVIPYFYGFSEEVYPPEIEAILGCLIEFSDINHLSDLASELDLLRNAVPGTKVELYYPAAIRNGAARYVSVDRFEEEVGVTFSKFLDQNSNRARIS
jgi:hypothetical protein